MISSNLAESVRVSAPVSIGELFDKITILQIKSERMSDESRLANVRYELALLEEVAASHIPADRSELDKTVGELRRVNEMLWDIEDEIRLCEKDKSFGSRFIELARAVYHTNDNRAALKRDINTMLGSAIVEEKSYAPY